MRTAFLILMLVSPAWGMTGQFNGASSVIRLNDDNGIPINGSANYSVISLFKWDGSGGAGDYLSLIEKVGIADGSLGWAYSVVVDNAGSDAHMTLTFGDNDFASTASSIEDNVEVCAAATWDDSANIIRHYKYTFSGKGTTNGTNTSVAQSFIDESAEAVIGKCEHVYVADGCYFPGSIAWVGTTEKTMSENEVYNACSNIRKVAINWQAMYQPDLADYAPAFPSTPIRDNFNRANGTIGSVNGATSTWTHNTQNGSGNWQKITIDTNEIKSKLGDSGGGGETYNYFGMLPSAFELYFEYSTLVDVGRNINVHWINQEDNLFVDPNSNPGGDGYGYLFEFSWQTGANDDVTYYYRQDGDNWTATPVTSVTSFDYAANDILGVRRVGDCTWIYRNGTAQITDCTDGTYRGYGWGGIFVTDDATPRYDDFGGGALGVNVVRDYSGNGNHTLNVANITPGDEQFQGFRTW